MVTKMPAVLKTQVRSLSGEDPLEKGMTTHLSVLAWRISWTEEPGGLQSNPWGHKESDRTERITLSPWHPAKCTSRLASSNPPSEGCCNNIIIIITPTFWVRKQRPLPLGRRLVSGESEVHLEPLSFSPSHPSTLPPSPPHPAYSPGALWTTRNLS